MVFARITAPALILPTAACTFITLAAQILDSVGSEGLWSQVRQQSSGQELLSYNRRLCGLQACNETMQRAFLHPEKDNQLHLHLWLLCSFCSSKKLIQSLACNWPHQQLTLNNYYHLEKHTKEAVKELSGYQHGTWTWVHHLNGTHGSASLQQYLRQAS